MSESAGDGFVDYLRRRSIDESFAQACLDPDGIRPVPMEIINEFIATEKVRVSSHRLMEKGILVKDKAADRWLEDAFRYDMDTYMIGILDEKVREYLKAPATWWDHFKAYPPKWIPDWCFRWCEPPEYAEHVLEVQAYKAVCPHIAGDDKQCRGFLVQEFRT